MIRRSSDREHLIIFLAVAANNPFLGDVMYGAGGGAVQDGGGADQGGQYYGRGYTQAQSGYSSSGLGY